MESKLTINSIEILKNYRFEIQNQKLIEKENLCGFGFDDSILIKKYKKAKKKRKKLTKNLLKHIENL